MTNFFPFDLFLLKSLEKIYFVLKLFQMEEKVLAESLFKGKKDLYPSSVATWFQINHLGNNN